MLLFDPFAGLELESRALGVHAPFLQTIANLGDDGGKAHPAAVTYQHSLRVQEVRPAPAPLSPRSLSALQEKLYILSEFSLSHAHLLSWNQRIANLGTAPPRLSPSHAHAACSASEALA